MCHILKHASYSSHILILYLSQNQNLLSKRRKRRISGRGVEGGEGCLGGGREGGGGQQRVKITHV